MTIGLAATSRRTTALSASAALPPGLTATLAASAPPAAASPGADGAGAVSPTEHLGDVTRESGADRTATVPAEDGASLTDTWRD
ncbi:hypothetical protein GCM10010275_14830 [Streptomyces litmocidini]|uniref:hypothetical protein n=1 Tax=Streptomyces litmocidini TaxID=67318 RepID=UPI00167E34CD|nr:hypothetical protein [Streptomyces litmocidini]GGU81048.1 hypothetical protein GCM10010275_14830 [Streptomyces litmocidini]